MIFEGTDRTYGQSAQDADIARALAPAGKLRVAVWMLSYFATENAATHDLDGVIPDLSRELARRTGVPCEFIRCANPGAVIEAFRAGNVDVTFVGVTADRAEIIDFGPVVVDIQTSYLVPASSSIKSIGEIDREGIRIVVPLRSAQEAYLKKTLTKAAMIGVPSEAPQQAVELLLAGKADAFSHTAPMLASVQPGLPGSRILPGSYFNVPIAIGHAKGRPAAAANFCRQFAEDAKKSGFVTQAIIRMGASAQGLVVHGD